MVNKTLIKEVLNFIKQNIRTFISQVLIVMLGVGFFVGIKVSVIDLQAIMTNFVNENEMYDYSISLEYGVGKEDAAELQTKLSNVKYMEGAYSQDMVFNVNGVNTVLKIHSYNSEKNINKLKVIEGKLPDKKTECVIDIQLNRRGYKVGDTIILDNKYLDIKELEITGVVQSPNYLAFTRGNSMLLSGNIDYYVYVNESNIVSDVYTELYLSSTETPTDFTEEYNNYLTKRHEQLNNLLVEHYRKKYETFKAGKQEEIDKKKAELEEKQLSAQAQLNMYEQQIRDAEDTIREVEATIKTPDEIIGIVNSILGSSQNITIEAVNQAKAEMDKACSGVSKQSTITNRQTTILPLAYTTSQPKVTKLANEPSADIKPTLAKYLKGYGYYEYQWGGTQYKECTSSGTSCTVFGKQAYAKILTGYKESFDINATGDDPYRDKISYYQSQIQTILAKYGVNNVDENTCYDNEKSIKSNSEFTLTSCFLNKGVNRFGAGFEDDNDRTALAKYVRIIKSYEGITAVNKTIAEYSNAGAGTTTPTPGGGTTTPTPGGGTTTPTPGGGGTTTPTPGGGTTTPTPGGGTTTPTPGSGGTSTSTACQKATETYNTALDAYNNNKTFTDLLADYTRQNDNAKATVARKKQDLNVQKKELANQRIKLAEEVKDAENKLIDAQHTLDKYENPKVYLFNRTDNAGYSQFADDIETISNLGQIIPIIFYLISFFMISSSVSKIVFEERNQIGTLKALGFNNNEIKSKYFIYSISIVVIGSILGMIIGTFILPAVIYEIYCMLYEFPEMQYQFHLGYTLIAVGIAFIVAIVSTILSCHNTLKELPISLLKLNPERFSKITFLERFPALWKKLAFSTRIALKNVFRYKTRVFMTVIGIGGCLALILTGLSLRTSIGETIPMQYGHVFDIDAQIFFSEEATQEDIKNITAKIVELPNVSSSIPANYITMTTKAGTKNINFSLVTLLNDEYQDHIKLKDPKTNKKLQLSSDGVIISEKLANTLNAKKGDTITIKDSRNKEYKIKISDITENYVLHYIYMNPEYYMKTFWTIPRNNGIFIQTEGEYEELELAEEIASFGNISQIMYSSVSRAIYEDVMYVLSILVILITVFSLLLVFAVLYNLINMNVRERTKEIATYKVLGFSDRVVCSILKKENTILLLIGLVFGVIFGRYLALIVIKVVEIEILSFVKTITPTNYIISIILTVGFTYLFSLLINKYVKQISLTESLKKNE